MPLPAKPVAIREKHHYILAMPGASKDISMYRKFLAVAAAVYFAWWFLVEGLLENSYNPLPGRLAVVGFLGLVFLLSFRSGWVRRHLQALYGAGVWLLTLHFFYLFYRNGGGADWIFGCFITVMAINYCFFSASALLCYTVFVLLLSALVTYLLPPLQHSVFFPGVLTIAAQANIGLLSRLRMLRDLRISNLRFQTLFNSTFEGVLVHESRRLVDANRPLREMLGFAPGELEGTDIVELIHPDYRAAAAEKIARADGRPYETLALTKQGAPLEVEVRARDIHYQRELARLVTVHDLTDRKKAERERIAARAMEENVRLRDEFISLASHELKTPLTSLKLWTQLLGRDLERDDLKIKLKGFLLRMGRQIDRLTELVESMLDVSQISTGRLALERQSVDLTELAAEVVANLSPQAESLGCRITFVGIPLPLRGDRSRLTQVVENLLTNAMKYGDGKPIEVRTEREGNWAKLVIQDRGLGIEPENISRIFDRFERVSSAKNISGLGLGLYLTRQIVLAHGGEVAVESHPGRGSAFTVKIPLL